MKVLTAALLGRWLIFPLAAYVFVRVRSRAGVARGLQRLLLAGTIVIGIASLAEAAIAVRDVPAWDFGCFYLYGHAVADHKNVYEPASFRDVVPPFATDADFAGEVLAVGFPYPPPSILLYAPLGLFGNVHLASLCWSIAICVALAAAIVALARPFGRPALLAVAALVLAHPATDGTIVHQQTNLFVLLVLALVANLRRETARGLAAALAVVLKPYLAVVPLWLLLRRRTLAFGASLAGIAAATAAAVPLVGGAQGVASYLRVNPAARIPGRVYSEIGSSSLYAELVRVRGSAGSYGGIAHDPLFLSLAALIVLASVVLVVVSSRDDGDLALCALLACGLIVYPGASSMYLLSLVPGVLALLDRVPASAAPAAALAAAYACGASAFAGAGALVFACLVWGCAAMAILRVPSSTFRPAGREAVAADTEQRVIGGRRSA